MNNKRTKLIVRIVAIVIAVLMVASVVLSAISIRWNFHIKKAIFE